MSWPAALSWAGLFIVAVFIGLAIAEPSCPSHVTTIAKDQSRVGGLAR